MANDKMPAYISHTVLVHAGSYNDFVKKLNEKYPDLHITFCRRKAIHYYVIQLEDHSAKPITKSELYNLPIMAFREEFSSYLVFKNTKGYNNVLNRMYNGKENKEAPYELCGDMLTPFEKSVLIDLDEAKTLEYEELTEKGEKMKTTVYDIKINNVLYSKLFGLDKIKVNNKEEVFSELAKNLEWKIAIH